MELNKQQRKQFIRGTILFIFSAILTISLSMKLVRVTSIKNQYIESEWQRDILETTKKNLQKEAHNLDNKEYVCRYAREHYIFTYKGEKVIKLPKETQKKQK